MYLPNCTSYATVLYGAAHAGGIVSTLNPVSTAEEIAKQLADSGARFLVTNPALLPAATIAAESLPRLEEIIVIDFDASSGATLPATAAKARVTRFEDLPAKPGSVALPVVLPTDTFILPYSSGTTGLPKGVVLTHANLHANMLQFLAVEEFRAKEDVLLAVLPFFHIYGMMIFLAAGLQVGLRTVVMPRFDLVHYLENIQKYKVTYLHVAPPIAVALAKHPMVAKYDTSSVRMIFSGAAPLGASTEAEVAKRLNCHAKQAYGMTEMSPMSHINPTHRIKSGTIGLLAPNCEAKIVHPETLAPVPMGQPGELLIRGPNVMREYLNKPEVTRETLLPDGFLRTGDMATVDADGYYTIVDRTKELIKYNGLQVAPAELEALLLTIPGVADAGVVGKPDETHGELPVAFVVLKEDPAHHVTEADIHAHFKQHAAPYKQLRGGIRFVKAIPKSISGKILRKDLKKML